MKKLALGVAALALIFGSVAQAANTVQDFTAIFEGGGDATPLLVQADADEFLPEIIDGWDGNAFNLTQEVAGQTGGFALNQSVSGPFDSLVFDFDFSITPGNNGGADGMSFAWISSADWGADNTSAFPAWSGVAEEPNIAGSFGVGFDTFNNADQGDGGENSISIHFDGQRIDSVPMDDEYTPETFLESGDILHANIALTPADGGTNVSITLDNLDSGDSFIAYENEFIGGMSLYDGRVAMLARTGDANSDQTVDNILITATPTGGAPIEVLEDFESYEEGPIEAAPPGPLPEIVGGTPFERATLGTNPPATIINEGGGTGEQEGYLRLTQAVGSQSNSIAFDKTSDTVEEITATFDFKVEDSGNNADGMAFLILDAGIYGDDGALEVGVSEEPNLEGVLGIGIDTYDNDEEGDFDESGNGCGGAGACTDRRANHFSLHYDGVQIGDFVWMDPAEFDIVGDEWNTMSVSALQTDDGLLVNASVRDANGNVFSIFSDELVDGADFADGARAAFAGRTGGAFSNQLIDNVNISWVAGEGLEGDFDNDGELGLNDIDLLLAAVKSGENSSTYDLTGDGFVNTDDIVDLVESGDKLNTYIGDSNLDGEFNSSDFVDLFTKGEYEDGVAMNSTWATGDWNGDAEFDSSDFVFAFTSGGYEQGPRAATAAVPEPSSAMLLVLGGLLCVRRRK